MTKVLMLQKIESVAQMGYNYNKNVNREVIMGAKKRQKKSELESQTSAKSEVVRARVTPELKQAAEQMLNQLGISMSDAITIFLNQVRLRGGLPFDVLIPNEETRKAIEDADLDRNMTSYQSVDELFKDLESDDETEN